MQLEFNRVTYYSPTCYRTVIPGHIYAVTSPPDGLIDIDTGAVYYAREDFDYDVNVSVGSVISCGYRKYTVSVSTTGQFSLLHGNFIVASVVVPECRGYTHDMLYFYISRKNRWRFYIHVGTWMVELELVQN